MIEPTGRDGVTAALNDPAQKNNRRLRDGSAWRRTASTGFGALLRVTPFTSDHVNSVALSGDGELAVSGSSDLTLKVWRVDGRREPRSLQSHSGAVHGVAVSGDGRIAISVSHSRDGNLKVWNVDSGRELSSLDLRTKYWPPEINGVGISRDGRIAISASDDTLNVWDVNDGCELRELQKGPIHHMP